MITDHERKKNRMKYIYKKQVRIKQTPREDGYYRKKSHNVAVTEEFLLGYTGNA